MSRLPFCAAFSLFFTYGFKYIQRGFCSFFVFSLPGRFCLTPTPLGHTQIPDAARLVSESDLALNDCSALWCKEPRQLWIA